MARKHNENRSLDLKNKTKTNVACLGTILSHIVPGAYIVQGLVMDCLRSSARNHVCLAEPSISVSGRRDDLRDSFFGG